MRALTLLLAALAMACFEDVDDFRFGPLSGQWSGTIQYNDDGYDWDVFIEQSNYSEPGGPFDGYQTFAMDSVLVKGPVTGVYNQPRVSLDFPVNLAPTPLLCEYRGRVDEELHRMTGHLSCQRAGAYGRGPEHGSEQRQLTRRAPRCFETESPRRRRRP